MKIKEPNYKNSITGIPNSILKYFECEPMNDSLMRLDKMLTKEYTNIILLVLDGMGVKVLKDNLPKDSLLIKNIKETISSTFPSTTVAATTSLESGQYPSQTGWLGWTQYFPEVDKNVVVFLNKDEDGNLIGEDSVAHRFYPFITIRDKIKQRGYGAYLVSKYAGLQIENIDDFFINIQKLSEKKEKKYIYAYYPEPDGIMHTYGCSSKETRDELLKINNKVLELCENIQNSLVIITADHGHIDSEGVCILDYPKIMRCLIRMPSIEPRAMNLFVKNGMKEVFENEFSKEFGNKFMLMTRAAVIDKKLFGINSSNKILDKLLGDYIAIAISDLTIFNTQEGKEKFKGVHSGITKPEMEVPLIVIER